MDVQGKVAVVTGAASGMGLAMARTFAAADMRVVLADIEADPLEEAASALEARGHEVLGVRTDVSDLGQVEALAAAAVDHFGTVHVLCNNAGVGVGAPIGATSMEDWRWTLGINLWGPIHGVHAFLPIMEAQGEGHINATASMAGLYAAATLGAYNVSKHGVVALMASLERDLRLAKSAVRASVLCPGPINTRIVDSQRNRPVESAAEHIETEAGTRFWDMLSRSLSEGMDPEDVGPMVLDAVVHEHFWIFTHPPMVDAVQSQVERARDDRTLTR